MVSLGCNLVCVFLSQNSPATNSSQQQRKQSPVHDSLVLLNSILIPMTGAPESTSIPSSTSVTASSSRSSTSTSVPTTSNSSSSSQSSQSSNTGAIAGGVVGGIVGLALIAALVFWWTRRRRARPTSSTVVDYMPAPMTESAVSPSAVSFNQTTPFGGAPSPKLYVRPSLTPPTVSNLKPHFYRTPLIRVHSLLRQRLLPHILRKIIKHLRKPPTSRIQERYTPASIKDPIILERRSFELCK